MSKNLSPGTAFGGCSDYNGSLGVVVSLALGCPALGCLALGCLALGCLSGAVAITGIVGHTLTSQA